MNTGYLVVIVFCLGMITTAMGFVLNYLGSVLNYFAGLIEAVEKMEKLLTDIRNSHDQNDDFRRFDK